MLSYCAIYSSAMPDRLRTANAPRSASGLLPHEIAAMSRRGAGRSA